MCGVLEALEEIYSQEKKEGGQVCQMLLRRSRCTVGTEI